MNTRGVNYITVLLFILIIVSVLYSFFFKNKISPEYWPYSILMISLSLVLIQGLTTNYLMLGDTYPEFEALKLTTSNLNWELTGYFDSINSCLSVSLLPTVLISLLGVDILFIPKVLYPALSAFIPVICYYIYLRILPPFLSYLSSIFFIFQLSFIYELVDHMRLQIALMLFCLYVLLIFDRSIISSKKRVLQFIFLFCVVLSYYSLPVIFLYFLVFLCISEHIVRNYRDPVYLNDYQAVSGVNNYWIFLLGGAIFVWWSLLTSPRFNSYVSIISDSLENLGEMFNPDAHHQSVSVMSSFGGNIPETLTILIHDFTFLLIALAILYAVFYTVRKPKENIFDVPYIVSALSMLSLAAIFVLVPYISLSYGTSRLYQTTLVILAPFAILGVIVSINIVLQLYYWLRYNLRPEFHLKNIDLNKVYSIGLIIFIVLQYLCVSGLLYVFMGVPYSEYLDQKSDRYNTFCISDSDVAAAEWLYYHTGDKFTILLDWGSVPTTFFGFISDYREKEITFHRGLFEEVYPDMGDYVVFRRANLDTGVLYSKGVRGEKLSLYELLPAISSENEIYSGGAKILIQC